MTYSPKKLNKLLFFNGETKSKKGFISCDSFLQQHDMEPTSDKVDYKKIVRRLMFFISFGILAHIIFVLLTTEKESFEKLSQIHIGYLLLILCILPLPWLGYATRLTMWTKFLEQPLTFKESIRIVVTAEVASALSPTAVGGAPVKGALLISNGVSPGKAGFILTLGVIEDIIFYTTGFVLALVFSGAVVGDILGAIKSFFASNTWIILVVAGLIVLGTILSYFRIFTFADLIRKIIPVRFRLKIKSIIEKARGEIHILKDSFSYVFRSGKKQLFISLSILFFQWGAKFTILLVILFALGVDFDLLQIYIRQWFIHITMLLVPTPGASGGAEASFLIIFGKSIPTDLANLIVSIWRFFTYYSILFMAIVIYQLTSINKMTQEKKLNASKLQATAKK